jgi:cytochrome c553
LRKNFQNQLLGCRIEGGREGFTPAGGIPDALPEIDRNTCHSSSFVSLGWAQEGESIYKSKCAACHGPTAEGKIGPSLKTTKLAEDDIVLLLSKGNDARKMPHKKPISSLTDDQIKAVAHYVKSLK